MKKIWKILFLSLVFLLISNISFASNARNLNEIKLASNTNNSSNQSETNENQSEEILKSQKESLNIFIKETKKYTEDSLEGIDLNELFSNAIAGKIDNKTILGSISKIARKRSFRLHQGFRQYCDYYCYT